MFALWGGNRQPRSARGQSRAAMKFNSRIWQALMRSNKLLLRHGSGFIA